MNTQDFALLRKKANMTRANVAAALGLAERTISAWESANPPKQLNIAEDRAVRDILRSAILEDRLADMCERAFSAVPSEMVAIWLVEQQQCILLPKASRLEDIQTSKKKEIMGFKNRNQRRSESKGTE